MFCKNCGNKIDDDSKFCSFCGDVQSSNNKQEISIVNEDIGINTEIRSNRLQQPNLNDSSNLRSTANNSQKSSRKYTLISSGLAILLIIFAVLALDDLRLPYHKHVFLAFLFLIRILVLFICSNHAKKLNRNIAIWGIFGFLLPAITLIVIGFLRMSKPS